ncbi:ParB/RepB/Spo0J family partition protein [Paratissierella segnis]|uniref:ParB/RepB/Spo0J family partition protein n=1 Tax=Paratissierella segnis TaxID=2763679 RepID=A0A926EUZ5_9FIRM|nr:ParB/RepB/Spo0J family partition protein [Paratissierella segnis]MBC8586720.1 ParB/RepB/Spo0J family partition protein [Paratissierella segnis]
MTQKKRGLGKGLSALISDKALVDTILSEEEYINDNIVYLEIDSIVSKEEQPRKYFDEEALEDLANSIRLHGIIQPIIVRRADEKYEIVAGERRWRASKKAQLKKIPCIIKDIDIETASKIALIENVQREDLNPIEEAIAYKRIMDEYNLKQEEIGEAIGKSRTYVANSIRLLNLHEKVIEYIYEGKLSSGHGKALLGIKDKDEQLKACEKIIDLGLNVRETEAEIKQSKTKPKKKRKIKPKESYIIDLEDQLMRSLGTKVNLIVGNKKGKIEIEYYGDNDLERLIDLLMQ